MTNLAAPSTNDSSASDASFVNFYELLGAPPTASTIQLRSRINEMYGEAQANRDHRNLDKRSQYATLLHWLPVCRAILLHEGKRAKYNAYAEQAEAGAAPAPFKPFLEELSELPDGIAATPSAPLSIRAQPAPTRSPSPTVAPPAPIETAAPDSPARTSAARTAPPSLQAQAAASVEAAPAPRRGWTTLAHPELRHELMSLLASASGGMAALLMLLITRGVLKLALAPAAIACAVAGALTWLVLHAVLVGKAPTQL